jgi:methylenetetrahydrofolate reductase (NADPH)
VAPSGGRRADPRVVADLLRNSRFELLPLDGIEDQVREHLSTDKKVTVTASPRKGLEVTLDLSERLAGAGYPVVPHIFARLVRDRAHLEDVLARLSAAGIRELFRPPPAMPPRQASSRVPPICSTRWATHGRGSTASGSPAIRKAIT